MQRKSLFFLSFLRCISLGGFEFQLDIYYFVCLSMWFPFYFDEPLRELWLMSFKPSSTLSPTIAGSASRENRDFRRIKVGALVGKSKEHTYLLNIEHAPARY